MEFKKYQHLEKFGTSEVQNLELGDCYVFPKLDGTNASVWIDENHIIHAGSRKRHLSLESDNAGFYDWVSNNDHIYLYLRENPTHRLFGEWLIPHALKTYKDESWKRFYIFDVVIDLEEELPSGEKFKYLPYNDYKPLLEKFELDYIPCIAEIKNGSYEQFINQLKHNVFMVEDGKGVGEGVVLKNYEFVNKYGRTTWAKIVTSEFKEKHAKVHGGTVVKGKAIIEEEIANKSVTTALVEKEYAKIENDTGFTSKMIPRLLNTVYYSLVKEECWNFIKEHRNPVIDFKRLQHFTFARVREVKPELF